MRIPVMFTFDENYVLPAAVAFESLLRNGDRRNVYALHVVTARNELSRESRSRLRRLVDSHANASIEFIEADTNFAAFWNGLRVKRHYSKEIFLKLFSASLLPNETNVIVSDVDVIFAGDIAEVFWAPDDGTVLQGVRGVQWIRDLAPVPSDLPPALARALQAGVGAGLLRMDLAAIRELDLEAHFVETIERFSDHLTQPEQDVLNIALEGRIGYLPLRFMVCTYLYGCYIRKDRKLQPAGDWVAYISKRHLVNIEKDAFHGHEDIQVAFEDPIQIHYATHRKPWNMLLCYRKLIWWRYLLSSGFVLEHLWCNEIANLRRALRRRTRESGRL